MYKNEKKDKIDINSIFKLVRLFPKYYLNTVSIESARAISHFSAFM